MGYVETNLLNGEEVLHKGEVHWQVFVPAIIFAVFGLAFLFIPDGGSGCSFGSLAPLFFLLALISGVAGFIRQATTELVVTNKRVIGKVGLIRRNSLEIGHAKIESLGVDQNILGRLLNYGTVTIAGTGGNRLPVRSISNPLQFRNKASEAGDSA